MNNAFQALLRIDELLPEAIALADLIQAATDRDSIISISSASRGADMLYSKLTQISQVLGESIKEVQQNDGKADL